MDVLLWKFGSTASSPACSLHVLVMLSMSIFTKIHWYWSPHSSKLSNDNIHKEKSTSTTHFFQRFGLSGGGAAPGRGPRLGSPGLSSGEVALYQAKMGAFGEFNGAETAVMLRVKHVEAMGKPRFKHGCRRQSQGQAGTLAAPLLEGTSDAKHRRCRKAVVQTLEVPQIKSPCNIL